MELSDHLYFGHFWPFFHPLFGRIQGGTSRIQRLSIFLLIFLDKCKLFLSWIMFEFFLLASRPSQGDQYFFLEKFHYSSLEDPVLPQPTAHSPAGHTDPWTSALVL